MVSVFPGLVTPGEHQLIFYYLLNTTQTLHFVNTLLKTGTAALLSFEPNILPSFHSKTNKLIQKLLICCATALRMNVHSADVEFNNVSSVSLLDKSWFHAAVFTLEAQWASTLKTMGCRDASFQKFHLVFHIRVLLFCYVSLNQLTPFTDTNNVKIWKCFQLVFICTCFQFLCMRD